MMAKAKAANVTGQTLVMAEALNRANPTISLEEARRAHSCGWKWNWGSQGGACR